MDIYSLSWYKVETIFKGNDNSVLNFSIFQAIIKGAYLDTFPKVDAESGVPIFFHILKHKYDYKIKEGQFVLVEIIISRHSKNDVEKIIKSLQKRMRLKENNKKYSLVSLSEPKFRNLEILEKELDLTKVKDESTINFLTPYSMAQTKKYPEGWIDTRKYLFKFKARLDSFFKVNLTLKNEKHLLENVKTIPYWNYIKHYAHKSKSQVKTKQYVHGFVGKLYFKGDVKSILPIIILGSELHSGSRTSNAQGFYTIIEKSISNFDSYFPNENQILKIIYETIERYDTNDREFKNRAKILKNLPAFAKEIKNNIIDENFEFTPSETFKLIKKDKTFRVIERFNFKEVVINNYILSIVYEPLNRFISEDSIGYRKGVSREKAIFLIKENLKEGYDIILESDIEAFFPSINLKKLKNILFSYIPIKDLKLREILLKSIYAKYKKNGKVHNRELGLAQGSSISPLLSNIYLNYFDRKIKEQNVRLVRYADDFIIMTKSFDKAIEVLKSLDKILGELNLKIKRSKTNIKSVTDGFKFLGYQFKGYENDNEIANFTSLLKKPIYIITPYVRIYVKHESLDLMKDDKIISSVPLRRVSEIIIMNKALISSSLAKKCREYRIPISFTFGAGYEIVTMKPDSKNWYTISSKHYNKYREFKKSEILEIAKSIVIKKINNNLKLFQKRDNIIYSSINKKLQSLKDKIGLADNINTIRGYEGIAAREVFKNYNKFIIDPEFHITKRERFSKEKINSLLNFGYYILFIRINSTVRAMGLNPYLGFLHSKNDRYESLVTDIQEFFRADIDNFIIKIVNMKIIEKDDFYDGKKMVRLKYDGGRKFINALEGEFNRKDKYKESLSEKIYLKILNIKNWVLEKENLMF